MGQWAGRAPEEGLLVGVVRLTHDSVHGQGVFEAGIEFATAMSRAHTNPVCGQPACHPGQLQPTIPSFFQRFLVPDLQRVKSWQRVSNPPALEPGAQHLHRGHTAPTIETRLSVTRL